VTARRDEEGRRRPNLYAFDAVLVGAARAESDRVLAAKGVGVDERHPGVGGVTLVRRSDDVGTSMSDTEVSSEVIKTEVVPVSIEESDEPVVAEVPVQLARILDAKILTGLTQEQAAWVGRAWFHSSELRGSLDSVERADNPTAMLVSISKRIIGHEAAA